MSEQPPRNRRERRAAERAARKAGRPYSPPKPGMFPADQDLAPGDISVASTIEPRHTEDDAQRIVLGLRDAYAAQAGQAGAPADVIVIAVPAGKGRPFLEGLELGLKTGGQLRGRVDLPGTEGTG